MRSRFILLMIFALLALPLGAQDDASSPLDEFLAAANPDEALELVDDVVASGADYETVHRALQSGREFSDAVPTGQLTLKNTTSNEQEHNFTIDVPETYDPEKAYGVIFYLHGGVSTPQTNLGERSVGQVAEGFAKEEFIAVAPSGHGGAVWWREVQVENINGILDRLKRSYNVDENRVFMCGFSDGGSGVYWFALKSSTPFAALLPWHGHIAVVANPRAAADSEIYVPNLRNKPLWVTNGARDQLYPTPSVQPFIDAFKEAGVPVTFKPNQAAHDFSWMGQLEGDIVDVFSNTKRKPYPDELSWQTDRVDIYNRVHWLVIDELGDVEGQSTFEDINVRYAAKPRKVLGVQLERADAGCTITVVTEDSVASAAGLEDGDEITKANGNDVMSNQDLVTVIQGTDWGEKIELTIVRDGKEMEVTAQFPEEKAAGEAPPTFARKNSSGRVELRREGNTVTVKTQGVKKFTLLFAPDQFDFTQPIKVITNGQVSFEGMVKGDVETLLHWAAKDQDRTMLFGAEQAIEVTPPAPKEEETPGGE